MTKTNVEIFREYIEQISNQKNFNLLFNYLTKDCIIHGVPYAGMGILVDDSSGERVIIKNIAPNAPATGLLQAGDEIIHVKDSDGEWKNYDDLKTNLWGQGKPGTLVIVTVRRAEQVIEVPIKRGRVEAFDSSISDQLDSWRKFLIEDCPDFKSEINLIIEAGDLVAYFLTDSGTEKDYQQWAIWAESGFVRFKDGKIIELWGVDDGFSRMKQLGFQIKEPEKVKS